jgi:hypothetical protein
MTDNIKLLPIELLEEMEACACACGSSVGSGKGAMLSLS